MKKKHKKPYKPGSPKAKEAMKKWQESLSPGELLLKLISPTPEGEKESE